MLLESRWEEISKHMKVDKVYLETHRDITVADPAAVDYAKRFFASNGVATAGGVTLR